MFLLCVLLFLNYDVKTISNYVYLFRQFVNKHLFNLYLFNFLRKYTFDSTLPILNNKEKSFKDIFKKVNAKFGNK